MKDAIKERILKNYNAVYFVDLNANIMDAVEIGDVTAEYLNQEAYSGWSYDERQHDFIENYVDIEDRPKYRKALSRDELMRCMQEKGYFQSIFRRVNINGREEYVKVIAENIHDEYDGKIILAYYSVTEDVFMFQKHEREHVFELTMNMDLVGKRSEKARVLLVDDVEMDLEILEGILEEEFEVVVAHNGKEALQVLNEYNSEIAVILLDILMPIMDGFEFLDELLKDPRAADIPVIITTGENREVLEEKFLGIGASDFINKPYNPSVVIHRVRNVLGIRHSRNFRKSIEFDEQTALYTRRAFLQHVSEMLASMPKDAMYDMLVINIKNLQLVRGVYGIEKTQEYLSYIAEFLYNDMIDGIAGRLGESIYAGFVPYYDRKTKSTVERDHKLMKEWSPIPNVESKIGIYHNVDHTLSAEEIVDRAIIAMDSIDNSPNTNIAYYGGAISEKHIREQLLNERFEKALSEDRFEVWYQPKISTESEEITGAEALIRWRGEAGNLISPVDFIPLFEKNGRIGILDEYTFSRVCELQRKRMDEGKEVFPISVNLSRSSLQIKGLEQRYKAIAERYHVPTELVPIEITETSESRSEQIKALVKALADEGFMIHLDDFGTGYSSLENLSDSPYKVLKLDKTLIDHIGDKKGDVLLQYTILLAHELGMNVVAEGVEEEYQLVFLKERGCNQIQGYLYSPPVTYEKFCELEEAYRERK